MRAALLIALVIVLAGASLAQAADWHVDEAMVSQLQQDDEGGPMMGHDCHSEAHFFGVFRPVDLNVGERISASPRGLSRSHRNPPQSPPVPPPLSIG